MDSRGAWGVARARRRYPPHDARGDPEAYDARVSMRTGLVRFLLAFALAWSGSAAQLHSLAHAQYELAVAGHTDKGPAPFKHASDQCLLVHALDGTAVGAGTLFAADTHSQYVISLPAQRSGSAPRLAFRSRAPPVLS